MFFKFIFALFCVAVISADAQNRIDNVAFIKLGSYSKGINGFHGKDYYIPRHTKLTWSNARSFCNSHGMDILAIGSKNEETSVLSMCQRNIGIVDYVNYIGGIATKLKDARSWYWVGSGDRIAYPIKWGPREPDNLFPEEWCLAIRNARDGINMIDHTCDKTPYKFICQQETFERE